MTHPHLEGLIAEVNAVATLADEARVAYAGHHASGTFRRIAERLDALKAALAALPGGGVDEAVERYDVVLRGTEGCTDGGCVVRKPVGMHTNGGCKCPTDKYKAQRVMRAAQMLRAALPTPLPHEADRNG